MRKCALTYDDIQLIPRYSEIESRKDVNLRTKLTRNFEIEIPIIASPMDTVCEYEMALKLALLGGVGCIHRFMDIDEQSKQIYNLKQAMIRNDLENWPVMAAVGVKEEDKERSRKLFLSGVNVLLIDVAHGDHKNVVDMIKWIKDKYDDEIDIIAGNVATMEGAMRLEKAGADAIRVGIGGGSLCTTRIKTGFGVPNVSSIEDVSAYLSVPVIADGGIRSSGDIVKALAVGADTVMLGSLLAGTDETPGYVLEKGNSLFKRYRGSASRETKLTHGQDERNIEGESTIVPYKGGVKYIIQGLTDGIRSGLSYGGCNTITEFRAKIQYCTVTNSGIAEAKPHLKNH